MFYQLSKALLQIGQIYTRLLQHLLNKCKHWSEFKNNYITWFKTLYKMHSITINWEFRKGELHTIFCTMEVLGKIIDASGLDMSLSIADTYGSTYGIIYGWPRYWTWRSNYESVGWNKISCKWHKRTWQYFIIALEINQ